MHIDDFLVYRVEEVTSTQDLAKELIERGDGSHGRVVISDSQTSGRGRYGREWISKTGNAYFTMLLNSKGSDEQICYIAGLALFDVLKQHITSHKIQLKWVNDILIDGKKIAGILLEKFDRFVLVGVGVNLIYDAVLEMMGATSIDQFVVGITRDKLVEDCLEYFKNRYNQWHDYGFITLKSDWLKIAFRMGEEIKVNFPNGEMELGILKTIDDNGLLILSTSYGEKRISVGELFDV